MSFANVLKQQLLHLRYEELGELYARTHGLLRFSKAFGPQKMLLQTENKSVAELYADSIFGLIGIGATISVNEYKNQNGKSFFSAVVDDQNDREKILRFFGYGQTPMPVMNLEQVQSIEELGCACSPGAFLACGSIVDPGQELSSWNLWYRINSFVTGLSRCCPRCIFSPRVLRGGAVLSPI